MKVKLNEESLSPEEAKDKLESFLHDNRCYSEVWINDSEITMKFSTGLKLIIRPTKIGRKMKFKFTLC